MEHFYALPICEAYRRTFLRHATIWVREEALIRGAMAAVGPNPHSRLLEAFRYLDHSDSAGTCILELAYVAEITPAEIAEVLNLAPEIAVRKLQWIQSWVRRVVAGEPHHSYQSDPLNARASS